VQLFNEDWMEEARERSLSDLALVFVISWEESEPLLVEPMPVRLK